jgi:hypothetical protein
MSHIASREPEVVRLTGRLSRSDLLWVANTAHGPGGHWHARVRDGEPDHDHLSSADAGWRYLADHRVPVPDGPPDAVALVELGVIREMVKRLLVPGSDPWTAEGRTLLAGARFVLHEGGLVTDAEPGWRGFCRDLLPPLMALIAACAPLRSCSNPACRLVFEDGSRNHGRRWCDTAGCGNRDRVRRARGRETGPVPVLTEAVI